MTETNVYQAIRTALDLRLTTCRTIPMNDSGIPRIHWEGVQFRPTLEKKWLKTNLLMATPSGRSLGGSPWMRLSGLYQVTVFIPSGEGPRDADILSDAIQRHFPSGERLTHGTTTVTITHAAREAAGEDPSWYWVPLSIYWRSFTDQI